MRISLVCMRSWCLGFPIWLTWFPCVSVLCFDYDYGTFCHYGLWMRICSRNWIKLLLDNRNLSVFLWMMRILELVLMNVISMSLFISLGGKISAFNVSKWWCVEPDNEMNYRSNTLTIISCNFVFNQWKHYNSLLHMDPGILRIDCWLLNPGNL